MSNNYFQFKQFRVEQNHAGMRVNTDGVLLGAWGELKHAHNCLDIGTGTGLIALMMAQRCNAQIDAVEIEEGACKDAESNFTASNWGTRLTLYNTSIQEFNKNNKKKYDAIFCNPPFFENALKSTSNEKNLARHTDSLSFEDLFRCTEDLLVPSGTFSMIIPAENETIIINTGKKYQLYPKRILEIRSHQTKPVSRLLIEFSFSTTFIEISDLTIYLEKTTNYTAEFINLTYEFYLSL